MASEIALKTSHPPPGRLRVSWCASHVRLFEEMKKRVTSWESDASGVVFNEGSYSKG